MRRFVFAPLAALLLVGMAALQSDAQESAAPAQPTASALLDQGWTADDRERWYGATQGSRLVPLSWLRALEQPQNEALFLDDAHMEALRYLPRTNGALPVGFAIDRRNDSRMGATRLRWRVGQRSDEPWVGFTCSACHTGQMTYQGATLRIEGGATLADFQGFIEGFNYALTQTRDDPARFERFATRVVGPANARDARRNRTLLRNALSDLVDYQNGIAVMNETSLRYGHGRLDAVGYILNKVSFVSNRNAPTANTPDAPVSYPFLWNVPQHRFVQWNGVAENEPLEGQPQTFDHGALGRNTGEVMGVFADIRPRQFMQIGARSSADVANLVALEQQLMRLRPPRWPAEIFGAPDRTLVAEGRALFGEHCVSCHTPLARTDLTTRNIERMVPFTIADFDDTPGTDPWMACNTATNEAVTGSLRGERRELIGGGELGRVEPASELLRVLVTQALLFQTSEVGASAVMSAWGSHPRPRIESSGGFESAGGARGGVAPPRPGQYSRDERRARCIAALQIPNAARILAYKARPLTGVWASAPYLHNGSVPNLYELLLPPAERTTRFNVGSREFDPVNVGYVTEARADNPFVFNARDEAGAIVEGNANLGHDYNNSALTNEQRRAIVEYLKVIGED